jgi:hypothetical protein
MKLTKSLIKEILLDVCVCAVIAGLLYLLAITTITDPTPKASKQLTKVVEVTK